VSNASQVQKTSPKNTSPEIPVVAIGASAGGLEAITAILRALPTDIAMAFMLIQHLALSVEAFCPSCFRKRPTYLYWKRRCIRSPHCWRRSILRLNERYADTGEVGFIGYHCNSGFATNAGTK
jgi:hypothetical protein